jgi:hypothetical protein
LIKNPPATIQKSTGSSSDISSVVCRLPLPLVLLWQAVSSLLTLRNTAFQDEALYLLAGRQIILSWMGKTPYLEPYGLYFSGYPSFYPAIGGGLDFLGGLELARLFSLLCMLIVTTCVYALTIQFFDRKSALFAAFFFACEGSVLFIGRLATYDAFCLCLLALAVMLCERASKAASARLCLAIGPLLLLTVAAKYAGLLFVPTVLALFAWWSWKRKGVEEMLVRLGIALFSLVAAGFLFFLNMDKQVLTGLSATTTNRASLGAMPMLVVQHIAMMEGIFFGLGLLGLLLCGRQRLPNGLLLFGSALLVPLYHTYKGEFTSLDKHLAFSMFFLAPLAGFAIASLIGLWQKRSLPMRLRWLPWIPALALCLLTVPLGLQQARNLYAGWPSSTQLTTFLRPRVQLGVGHYLAEDFDVLRYDLKNETALWQWSSLDYFVYTDKQKHDLSGEAAYNAAIQDGYFEVIELSYGYHTPLAMQIAQSLTASKRYNLIAKIPIHNAFGSGYYWVWSQFPTAQAPSASPILQTEAGSKMHALKQPLQAEPGVAQALTFAEQASTPRTSAGKQPCAVTIGGMPKQANQAHNNRLTARRGQAGSPEVATAATAVPGLRRYATRA